MKTRRPLSIVVLGGGVAGLSAALALAREGHAVSVIERDEVAVGQPLESLDWDRTGIPHFMQPHAFTPRGRMKMQLERFHGRLADEPPTAPGAERGADRRHDRGRRVTVGTTAPR